MMSAPDCRAEDCVAGVLHHFSHSELRSTRFAGFILLDARQDSLEVSDSLIILPRASKVFALGIATWDAWWKKDPSLDTDKQRIPRARRQGVDVRRRARAIGPVAVPQRTPEHASPGMTDDSHIAASHAV